MIKLLRGKRVSNIFSVRDHRKFILKNLIFFNSKLNGRKLGFNTPLRFTYKAKTFGVTILVLYSH